MLKKILILISFFISPALMAGNSCSITSYSKIWTIDGTTPSEVNKAIKKSNCSLETKQIFLHFILTRKGNIHSSIIEREIKKSSDISVSIKPRKLQIKSLNSTLKEKFSNSENWFFKNLTLNSKNKVLVLEKSNTLLLHCNQCEFAGSKNIKLIIQDPVKNLNYQEWAQAKIKVRVEALTAIGNYTVTNAALRKEMFIKRYVYVSSPEKLFTNYKGLVFYKLNKPLRHGQVLNFSDLSSVNLVQAGRPTKIILKHKGLSLSGQALPMRPGKYGEIIQLRHPVTRKLIIGKIIDFNKVSVEF